MPIQQVAALLHRWEQASGVVNRGRVVADGMRLLSGLSPEERRTMARALAEEGAPELAQRLDAVSSGGGRADASNLHDAAAGLLTLDRQQVAHLADVLSDPDERRRLAHDAATKGLELLDEPPSAPPPDPASRLPPGTSPTPSPGDRPGYSTDALHAIANGEVPLDDPELGDQLLDHPDLVDISLGLPSIHEIGLSLAGPVAATSLGADGTVAEDRPPPPPGSGSPAVAEPTDADPPGDSEPPAHPDDDAVGSHDPDDTPAADNPDDNPVAVDPDDPAAADDPDDASAAGGPDGRRGDAEGAFPARGSDPALLERLRAARTAHQRFAALAGHHLGGLDPPTTLAVLDAVPEGWQRRRAVDRLGSAGTLHGLSAAALLGRFPRPSDATFVAATAIDHGALSVDDLIGQLPDHVVRRLAARVRR